MGMIALLSPPSVEHPTVGIEGLQKVAGPLPAACGVTQTFCIFLGESGENSRVSMLWHSAGQLYILRKTCTSQLLPQQLVFFEILTNVLHLSSISHLPKPLNQVAGPVHSGFSKHVVSPCSRPLPILGQSLFPPSGPQTSQDSRINLTKKGQLQCHLTLQARTK